MTIGVYGLGRFGSFWSGMLSRVATVCAYSRSPDRSAPAGVRRVGEEEALSQEALVLCVAISSVREVLARIGPRLPAHAIVMDTCSVKMHPVRLMQEMLPGSVQILGTHPMFGPDSARAGAAGLPMILCPVRVTARELERWRALYASLGLAVSIMTADEHDREAAFTQGVAHYVGRVLADLGVKRSPIGTVGNNKLLEIVEQTCNDPWQLFLDLQRLNPHTREMRLRLEKSIASVLSAIDGAGEEIDRPGEGR
jgi:prephenate dehydrogenase